MINEVNASANLEMSVEYLQDEIQKYNDSLAHQFNLSTGSFHIIEGLLGGAAAGIVILTLPEIMTVAGGIIIEQTAEQGLLAGVLTITNYIAASMGAAGSILEIAVGIMEETGAYKPSPHEKSDLNTLIDLTNPISLIAGASMMVYDSVSKNQTNAINKQQSLERGAFAGKILSLTMEITNLGRAMFKPNATEIMKESYQTALQTAQLGSSPFNHPSVADLLNKSRKNSSHLGIGLPDYDAMLQSLKFMNNEYYHDSILSREIDMISSSTSHVMLTQPRHPESWGNTGTDNLLQIKSILSGTPISGLFPVSNTQSFIANPKRRAGSGQGPYILNPQTHAPIKIDFPPDSNLPSELGGADMNRFRIIP